MRLGFLAPVLTFAVIAALMLYALFFLNPKEIPSELVSKPAPEFQLEPVPGYGPGLGTSDLKQGKVVLLNVFASWCVACLAEHPLLVKLKQQGVVDIYGLNYKDKPDAAAKWLTRHGTAYTRTGMDLKGRVGIDFGVYGVPETFIIDGEGRILDKIIGPITEHDLETRILPRVSGENG
ncbi:DsbE family thiol:disulfide interchange protein [Sneathiella chinensis]|uniref:Cytochrome C-type biogenesis protein n=1 Tax=Sneathiella chinensis TaxID=349750 RepID=A0ABQ5U8T9_9PROT|nr:DsbE family thiol:disulfide interchange protein [Sneathiella chinensis]GLQ07821.1 cytochrome C-type biogenesis protein [Sneathiella chinensis]